MSLYLIGPSSSRRVRARILINSILSLVLHQWNALFRTVHEVREFEPHLGHKFSVWHTFKRNVNIVFFDSYNTAAAMCREVKAVRFSKSKWALPAQVPNPELASDAHFEP